MRNRPLRVVLNHFFSPTTENDMERLVKTLAASSLAIFAISASPLFTSNSDDHGHEMKFDPVGNEFGRYPPDLQITKAIEVGMSDDMTFTPDVIHD